MPTPRPSRRAVEPDNDDEDDFMPMPSKGKKAVDAVSWFHPSSHPPGTPTKRKAATITEPDSPTALLKWADEHVTAKRKLDHTIGIELTMMPPYLIGSSDATDKKLRNVDSDIADAYGGVTRALLRRIQFPVEHAGQDQKAVEVASKVLHTWPAVRTFYNTVSGVMLDIGLRPHVEHMTSGGGHIHVGGLSAAIMASAFRDVQNRPWLNWVFNDPDDARSANSTVILTEKIRQDMREACEGATSDPMVFANSLKSNVENGFVFFGDIRNVKLDWLPTSKQSSLRYCDEYETLEFRFFQAPVDWAEQAAHLRFVEAYLSWLSHNHSTHCPPPTVLTTKQLSAWKETDCAKEFKHFLTELGLPYAPYARMVEENLPVRFLRKKLV